MPCVYSSVRVTTPDASVKPRRFPSILVLVDFSVRSATETSTPGTGMPRWVATISVTLNGVRSCASAGGGSSTSNMWYERSRCVTDETSEVALSRLVRSELAYMYVVRLTKVVTLVAASE